MPLTRGFTDEIKELNAEPILGTPVDELLDDTISRIAKQGDSPVRLYASATADENLNIGASVVEMGDGAGKSASPVNNLVGAFAGGTISFQSRTATATIKVGGATFSFPTSTVGKYRRLVMVITSTGTIDSAWSAETASVSALADPGTLLSSLTGNPCGYIDLECTYSDGSGGKFKTAGSATNVIENKVGSTIRIFRFGSGAGAGSSTYDFNKYIGSGTGIGWYSTIAAASPTAGDRILVVSGYTLTATETWAFNNVTIVFMPNQKLNFTAATTSALVISGNGNRIYDLFASANIVTTLTNGILVSGTDNQLYGATIEANNASLTITNAVSLTGQRNVAVGDRVITAGAITYKVGVTAVDSIALISGVLQNNESTTQDFTKYVGTKPTNSDGKNWYATVAAASPTTGDRILVVGGYSLGATETWAFNDVTITFMPGQQLTFTAATTSALVISGARNRIYDIWVNLNISGSMTDGILVSGVDNHIYGGMVETTNAGLTLTDAYSLTGARNTVFGDRKATAGTITYKIGSTITDSAALISGSFQSADYTQDFNKYIGTKPPNSDGKEWYTTLAGASPSAGDRILVVGGLSFSSTETWAFSNVTIVWMPNRPITFTGATTSALIISGNGNHFYDLWVRANITGPITLTNGISVTGTDNQFYGSMVETFNSGTTITNAYNLSGQRNVVVGERLATSGTITNKIGTTALDSAALVSGSFQNAETTTDFTKYVGTKPSNSDGKNWYATIAAASPTDGDRILLVTGYTLTATEVWTFNNVTIVSMPNQILTFTNATLVLGAVVISGINNRFQDLWIRINMSGTLIAGVNCSGTNNQFQGLTVEAYNSGLTISYAVNVGGGSCFATGARIATLGTITNKIGTTASDSIAIISGSIGIGNTVINSNIGGDFNKYVGGTTGPGWYSSISAATPSSGDRILVVGGFSLIATETWSFNNVTIVFMPGQQITFTGATTSALIISGNKNKLYEPWIQINIAASLTNGISITGTDNQIFGAMVEGTNAGLTLTNAYSLSGQRNTVIGERLASLGAITYRTGTTATDSVALISGALQSNEYTTQDFTKYIGTKPTSSDGKNWYTTFAGATPTAGDRILITAALSLSDTEVWSFSNVTMVFMPTATLTFTGTTGGRIIEISGSSNTFYDMYVKLNTGTSVTNGILISGNDNKLLSTTVDSVNSSNLITFAFNAIGVRNNVIGDRKVSAGRIINEVNPGILLNLTGTLNATTTITMANTTGIVAGMIISGVLIPIGTSVISVTPNTSITISVAATGSASGVQFYFSDENILRITNHHHTAMFDVGGFARINSPTVPLLGATAAGNYEYFDCSSQHIFYKTATTGTVYYTLSNMAEGQTVNIVVSTSSGVTSPVITWTDTPKWAGGTIPTPTATASKFDVYTFIKIGGLIFGSALLNMS